MASIDITELLTDPDFVDRLTIINRASTVNDLGENVLTETPFQSVGSVQPADAKTIERLPEALQSGDVRSFWIKGEISSGGKNKYPDIILFHGKRFQVQTAAPWLNWGAGWSHGVCVDERPA